MKQKDLINAKNPDLRGSLAAMQRAAQSARDIAIQTNTAIIVVRNGQRVRITASELLEERERNVAATLNN